MYIRKILIGILIVGIAIGFYMMYHITQTIFKPVTSFTNETAYVYIPSNADFNRVKEELLPLVNDIEAFEILATKKGYIKQVKGGMYILKKDMNSNDIVNTLLDKSTPVKVTIPNSENISLLSQQVSLQIQASAEELTQIMNDTLFLKEKEITFPQLFKSGTYTMVWNMSATEFRDFMFEEHVREK